jgi:hypothetical protein
MPLLNPKIPEKARKMLKKKPYSFPLIEMIYQ